MIARCKKDDDASVAAAIKYAGDAIAKELAFVGMQLQEISKSIDLCNFDVGLRDIANAIDDHERRDDD